MRSTLRKFEEEEEEEDIEGERKSENTTH